MRSGRFSEKPSYAIALAAVELPAHVGGRLPPPALSIDLRNLHDSVTERLAPGGLRADLRGAVGLLAGAPIT